MYPPRTVTELIRYLEGLPGHLEVEIDTSRGYTVAEIWDDDYAGPDDPDADDADTD